MTGERPPLVLHVIHHLVIGGMENGLVNLVNRMPAHRYAHAIACIEDHSSFRDRIARPGVEVHALHRSRRGIWAVRRALYGLCRSLRPAIVHTRGLSGLDALVPACLAGVPHRVHSEHGWDVSDLHGTSPRTTLLRKLHAPFVDRYITVSKDLERHLRERVGVSAARITQIYNGVDTLRFTPARADRSRLLPHGFAPEGTVVFGTVGRLQPVKDQATLIRAYACLAQTHPRARLVVVGDGPLQAELRALAATLGVQERIHFTGALDDVLSALHALDVFVLPSLNEGISNTILEAMACGLPVLATAVGGNVELVEDGMMGHLFAPGDVPALADHMASYVSDDDLRRTHGARARVRAEAQFGLDRMVDDYVAVYDAVIGKRAGLRATPRPSSGAAGAPGDARRGTES
jgi:sugar transferase (PEP-CTERM/EpsH1 system associated)